MFYIFTHSPRHRWRAESRATVLRNSPTVTGGKINNQQFLKATGKWASYTQPTIPWAPKHRIRTQCAFSSLKLAGCGPGFLLAAKKAFAKKLRTPGKGLQKPPLMVLLREMLGFIKTLDKDLTASGTRQHCLN